MRAAVEALKEFKRRFYSTSDSSLVVSLSDEPVPSLSFYSSSGSSGSLPDEPVPLLSFPSEPIGAIGEWLKGSDPWSEVGAWSGKYTEYHPPLALHNASYREEKRIDYKFPCTPYKPLQPYLDPKLKKRSNLEVRTFYKPYRRKSSDRSQASQHESSSRGGGATDEASLEPGPSEKLCTQGVRDGIGPDLPQSHATTPAISSEVGLSTVETSPGGIDYLSPGEGCSESPTEADSTEYGFEICNGDGELDILRIVCQVILNQMLSLYQSDTESLASYFIRDVAEGKYRSQSPQPNSLAGPYTPSSVSSYSPGGATKGTGGRSSSRGGGGGKELKGQGGGPNEQREEPNEQGEGPNEQEEGHPNSRKMNMPCLYYLVDPDKAIYQKGGSHENCRSTFSRIVQHIERTHLRPEQCLTCGYRNDRGRVREHSKSSIKCKKKEFDPVEQEVKRQYRLLKSMRNPTMGGLFGALFPNTPIPPRVQRYINLEQGYPKISGALINYIKRNCSVIIGDFQNSPEFRDLYQSNPNALQLMGAYQESSGFAVADIERTLINISSTLPGISLQPPSQASEASPMKSFNTSDSHDLVQQTQSSLRASDQPSGSDQFVDPVVHTAPSGIPVPPTTNSCPAPGRSDFQVPSSVASGAVDSPRGRGPVSPSPVSHMYAGGGDIPNFEAGSQGSLISPRGFPARHPLPQVPQSELITQQPQFHHQPSIQRQNVDTNTNFTPMSPISACSGRLMPHNSADPTAWVPEAINRITPPLVSHMYGGSGVGAQGTPVQRRGIPDNHHSSQLSQAGPVDNQSQFPCKLSTQQRNSCNSIPMDSATSLSGRSGPRCSLASNSRSPEPVNTSSATTGLMSHWHGIYKNTPSPDPEIKPGPTPSHGIIAPPLSQPFIPGFNSDQSSNFPLLLDHPSNHVTFGGPPGYSVPNLPANFVPLHPAEIPYWTAEGMPAQGESLIDNELLSDLRPSQGRDVDATLISQQISYVWGEPTSSFWENMDKT